MSILAGASTWFFGLVNQAMIQANLIDPVNAAFAAIPSTYITSVSITPTAVHTVTSVAVAFPAGMFTVAPFVTPVIFSSANIDMQVTISGTTTTGCTVNYYAGNTGARTISIKVDGS